jgi:hypothetical protein
MTTVRDTQKKYGSRAMMVCIFISLGFILMGEKAMGKGLILGSIFSVVNFVLIGETLPARIAKARRKTFFISLGSIFFRYVLMAIPIVLAVKFDKFNLYAAVAGLFAVQLVILADHAARLLPIGPKQQV